MELIKFNLFDNSGTFADYVNGRTESAARSLKMWPQMRLPPSDPNYADVGGDGAQVCKGELIRFRTVSGICNDILNPAMGSTGHAVRAQRGVRNDVSRPGQNELTRNRHGDRLALLQPDPQVISRKLFTRAQSIPDKCNAGYGMPGNPPMRTATTRRRRSSTCWPRTGSSS